MRLQSNKAVVGVALVVAIILALVSVKIERLGPEQASYGNLCGPEQNEQCYQPVLKGGFPFAYMVDDPATSVLRQLGPEDDLLMGPLLVDICLYFALLLLAIQLLRPRPRLV